MKIVRADRESESPIAANAFRVVYFRIGQLDYPRNRLIRGFLQDDPRFQLEVLPKATEGGRLRRLIADYRMLWRASQGAQAIILAEFSNSQAFGARIVSRLRGASLIVDGFVGLAETGIQDRALYSPRSLQGLRLRVLDRIAADAADLYLIDTEMRAHAVRATYRSLNSGLRVLSVPVGAPVWARWQPPSSDLNHGQLSLLYYGNYIPLHGLTLLFEGLARVEADWHLTMIGSGQLEPEMRRLSKSLQINERITFLPPVPEEQLIDRVRDADVVVGVFGDSAKARSVLANKVWQGLCCGRRVITQDSEALDELRPFAGPLLHTSEPGSRGSIANEVERLARIDFSRTTPNVTQALRNYTDQRLERFGEALLRLQEGTL